MIQDKIKLIAKHYGLENQINKLFEEMAELQVAISKYRDGYYDSMSTSYANVVEELADVRIMTEQMMYLLDCEDKVAEIKQYKVERTLKKINGTYDELEDMLDKALEKEVRRFKEG